MQDKSRTSGRSGVVCQAKFSYFVIDADSAGLLTDGAVMNVHDDGNGWFVASKSNNTEISDSVKKIRIDHQKVWVSNGDPQIGITSCNNTVDYEVCVKPCGAVELRFRPLRA